LCSWINAIWYNIQVAFAARVHCNNGQEDGTRFSSWGRAVRSAVCTDCFQRKILI
jgi:hypothetical protein